jgi:HlyD family secretion protein
MKRSAKRWILLLVIVLVIVVALGALRRFKRDSEQTVAFRTAEVTRGDLTSTISATGTVEPEEVIDVGAQVAGKILEFGKDASGGTVDYGSRIEEGTVLAKIDDALYAADVAQGKAQVQQAVAGVVKAEADLGQLQAKLKQAERDWERAKKLGPSDALARADYDAAQSAYEAAVANVAVGKAAIEQAKRTADQARATLQRSQQNLDYCTIQSPVKGVIIDRRVNIGQTVVASLSAPSLFLIAKDLTRLQVWVAVNEADIGNIHKGQPVTFTVDAYPGEEFKGEVGKVRLNATMTQNVVTYTVEVQTDNSSGRLLPYLTANVQFLVAHHPNVLMIPNSALRWTPQQARVVPGQQLPEPEQTGKASAKGKPERSAEGSVPGVLWVPEGRLVRPVPVRLGHTDGSRTEITGGDVKEGMAVVTGEQPKDAVEAASASSPFMPKIFRGGRH